MVVSARESTVGTWTFVMGMVPLLTLFSKCTPPVSIEATLHSNLV